MAKTTQEAFNDFMTNIVNLDREQTTQARGSRDWLVEQINCFPVNDITFPENYLEKNIFYGSFSRNTKTRPLDDIDMMICMKGDGCTYFANGDKIQIYVPPTANRLIRFVHDGTNYLNSRKIINIFISKLINIAQYKKADVNRNGEAVVLDLQSHDWSFDIVPCFFTTKDTFQRDYYLIPDGQGNWKKTDPRLDGERVINLNKQHNGRLLNVIRAIKYWNKRPTMPTINSYLLENMILDYYSVKPERDTDIGLEIARVFIDLMSRVYLYVNDPKNIQGDLNTLSADDRRKISQRAKQDSDKSIEALLFQSENKQEESIKKWTEIFGDKFPKYE